MGTIKIRNPKGLYTNHDESDLSFEHFKLAENWRFKDGYMETMFYELQPYTVDIDFQGDEAIVLYDTVNFNNDPLGVDLVGGELKSNYKYNLIKAELLITRRTVGDHFLYTIYIRDEETNVWFTPPNATINPTGGPSPDYDLMKDFDKSLELPHIFYSDGNVKIFLPHQSLWLGKINRTKYWADTIGGFNNYWLSNLVETYDPGNLGVAYNDGLAITAPGRRIGVTWDYNIITTNYTETKELRFSYANEEGIWATVGIGVNQRWQWYRKYNVYYLDEPNRIIKTIKITSLTATSPDPPQLNFMKFQRDTTDSGLFEQNPDNFWMFDVVKHNGIQLTQPTFYYQQADPGGGNTPIGLEEFSAAGEMTLNKSFNITERGFAPTFNEPEIIVTAVYDNADEFVIAYDKLLVETSSNYALEIDNVALPYNSTKRVTVINFYLKKHKDEADYEQVKSFNLLSREELSLREKWVIDKLTPNGIFMNQTIGIIFDYSRHKLIQPAVDYEIANGIAYLLKDNIIHYPSIGNGKVSENIFYEPYFIPNISEDEILSLSNIKETLAVHTKKGMKLVLVHDLQVGELFFVVKDTIGYIITNREESKQATPDGVFLLTKQGIILSDGQNDGPISKPVDDVVEKYFKTGGIFFNEQEKELWFYTGDGDIIYIFNFQYKRWSTVNLQGYGNLNVSRIFLNNNLEIIIQAEGDLYKAVSVNTGIAKINTVAMDLEEMATWKQILFVLIDFEGISWYGPTAAVTNSQRSEHIFDIRIDRRIPTKKIGALINFKDKSKFYGMEIEYDNQFDRDIK